MRFNLLFFFVFLGVLYLSLAQAGVTGSTLRTDVRFHSYSSLYEDCCLSFTKEIKPSVKKRVISYRRQEQDGGCNLPAIVFKLKSGRQFCARPGDKWVQDLLIQTEHKKTRNRHRKH
ncbi:C-C motif chemokine 25 isoform X1 [Hemibagrus wyckioides]|uniref:C-C motif chemokine 25 isoform X1 n=1 Tax=Hemibagrus wyckioides TaxID=337641 RepID=UPI00266D2A7D|nr:C-C motif chemokine 25 isoform X1 [Hemibagrus wyckioides]